MKLLVGQSIISMKHINKQIHLFVWNVLSYNIAPNYDTYTRKWKVDNFGGRWLIT